MDQHAYDVWGKPTGVSESVPQQLRYASYWYDNELGWYWLSTRPYDPVLERFMQPDLSQLGDLFSYVYANDDPVDGTDASGEMYISTHMCPDGYRDVPPLSISDHWTQPTGGGGGATTTTTTGSDGGSGNSNSGGSAAAPPAGGSVSAGVVSVGGVTYASGITYLPVNSVGCARGVIAYLTSANLGGSTMPQGIDTATGFDRGHLLAASLGGSNSQQA